MWPVQYERMALLSIYSIEYTRMQLNAHMILDLRPVAISN